METQLAEHSQISNKIQSWTQLIEQKNNDRIVKRREEMDNKLEAFLKEIMTSKTTSTVSNLSSETNETQNEQLPGSKNDKSKGVQASKDESSDTEDED